MTGQRQSYRKYIIGYLIYQGLLLRRLQASRRVTLVKVNLSPLILVSVVRQRSTDGKSFAE